jgi:tetratricopeptide (TPR) repeat protein
VLVSACVDPFEDTAPGRRPPERPGGPRPAVLLTPYGVGMRGALNFDDIEQLEVSARTPKAHRRAAAKLAEWAAKTNRDDEVTPADLLSAAGWHLDQAGDTEAALDLYRRAVAAEGTTTPDARCLLHAALLQAGRLDEARQVADDLRRARPRIIDFAAMAETFELVGDLQQAHRWAAMGVNRLQLTAAVDAADDDYEIVTLLDTRRRIREALGFPPDELDELDETDP